MSNGRHMIRLVQTISRQILGEGGTESGYDRTLAGLRTRDRRELMVGLALVGLSYLRRTKPSRQLIYKKSVPAGSAVVIHHRKRGKPKIEVVKPKR